jgi:hypothetical protein
MTSHANESGEQPVIEITAEEAWAMLDADARRYLGIGAKEFAARYNAGEYDDPDDDPVIMRLAFDLEFLQRHGRVPAE